MQTSPVQESAVRAQPPRRILLASRSTRELLTATMRRLLEHRRRFALAIVKPGGNALLIDAKQRRLQVGLHRHRDHGNTAFAWRSLAMSSAIDSDRPEAAAAVHHLVEELRCDGHRPVLIALPDRTDAFTSHSHARMARAEASRTTCSKISGWMSATASDRLWFRTDSVSSHGCLNPWIPMLLLKRSAARESSALAHVHASSSEARRPERTIRFSL